MVSHLCKVAELIQRRKNRIKKEIITCKKGMDGYEIRSPSEGQHCRLGRNKECWQEIKENWDFWDRRAKQRPSMGHLEHQAQELNPVTQHQTIQGKSTAPLLCFAFARFCRDIYLPDLFKSEPALSQSPCMTLTVLLGEKKYTVNWTGKIEYKELLFTGGDWSNKRLASKKVKSSREDKKIRL